MSRLGDPAKDIKKAAQKAGKPFTEEDKEKFIAGKNRMGPVAAYLEKSSVRPSRLRPMRPVKNPLTAAEYSCRQVSKSRRISARARLYIRKMRRKTDRCQALYRAS